jgi:hypothetical protein
MQQFAPVIVIFTGSIFSLLYFLAMIRYKLKTEFSRVFCWETLGGSTPARNSLDFSAYLPLLLPLRKSELHLREKCQAALVVQQCC